MQEFLRIYAESEEILYKMCNENNTNMRHFAINRNFNGLINATGSIWRTGMASPSGKKILKQIENNSLKVSYKKMGKFRNMISKFKIDERRYKGLNLTNIGSEKKNTIEFRMANGTLNFDSIKENVFLYASLLDYSVNMLENPEKYTERREAFLETDISEEEKANRFLDLIIDDDAKKIFIDRWKTNKDCKTFEKNDKKGFAQRRFIKEDFKNISEKVPKDMIDKTFKDIKNIFSLEKNDKKIDVKQGEKADDGSR